MLRSRGPHPLSTSCGNLATVRSRVSTRSSASENVLKFKEGLRRRLSPNNQDLVTDILSLYHRNRNVHHLFVSLTKVLTTRESHPIFFLLRDVLPQCDRAEYDHFVSLHFHKLQQTESSVTSRTMTYDSGFGHDHSASSSGQSSTFGSAVRRKVKAALQRTISRKSKTPIDRNARRHSFAGHRHSNDIGMKRAAPIPSKLFIPPTAQEVIIDRLQSRTGDMGFSIRGGVDHGMGIFVSQVDPNSIAEKSGLLVGDQLLLVNGKEMNNVTHQQAVKVLTSQSRLYLTVQSNVDLEPNEANPVFSWMDTQGRPTSPPIQNISNKRKSGFNLLTSNERKVNISVRPGQSLGLMIRGGLEYNLGVYITGVDEGSAADNAGLKPGDEIMDVNGIDFRQITHSEAVNIIRSSSMLMMTISHVGKVPQCDMAQQPHYDDDDEPVTPHEFNTLPRPPGGSIGAFDRAVTGSSQVTLRHAQSTSSLAMSTLDRALNNLVLQNNDSDVLNDAEHKSVRYYVGEYLRGTVAVDDLVMSLSQLLNTHEKFSVMAAVRRCMLSKDLDRFDVLVLRRELESLKKAHLMKDKEVTQKKGTSFNTIVPPPPPPVMVEQNHEPVYAVIDKTKKINRPGTSSMPLARATPSLGMPRATQSMGAPVSRAPSQKKSASTNTDDTNGMSVSTSTPNSSAEFPPPPIIVTPPNQDYSHCKLKKTISPILRNTGVLPPRSDPPMKPKRSKTNEEIRDSPFKHQPIYNGDLTNELVKVHRSPSPFTQALDKQMNKTSRKQSPNNSSSDDSFTASNQPSTSATSSHGVRVDVHTRDTHLQHTVYTNDTPPYLNVSESRATGNSNHQFPPVPKIQISPNTTGQFNRNDGFNDESSESESDPMEFYRHVETQKVIIFKTTGALGLSIEGGANTRQPIPRISKIQPGGCAHLCGRLVPGHVIHKVNGLPLEGIEHTEVARVIASAFKAKDRDSVELEISGPHQSAL